MDGLIDKLTSFIKKYIVSFTNDEIIINATSFSNNDFVTFINMFENTIEPGLSFKVSTEVFQLRKIKGTDGYAKVFFNGEENEFKCVNGYDYPFVLREYLGQEKTENDRVFMYEGKLAKFLDVPSISLE
jgi:hypothetical protein